MAHEKKNKKGKKKNGSTETRRGNKIPTWRRKPLDAKLTVLRSGYPDKGIRTSEERQRRNSRGNIIGTARQSDINNKTEN